MPKDDEEGILPMSFPIRGTFVIVEVCGFCHRENVEDVCGELHVERTAEDVTVAAHQKCMKCSICSWKKKKKKGSLFFGATAGCAIKSCRKSFHYYCARMSDRATTKRLEVKLKSKGEKTILYRVFCSEEHEQQFMKNKYWKEEYKAIQNKNGENDDTNDDDDEENNENGEKEEEEEDEDSDDDESDDSGDPDYNDYEEEERNAVEDDNKDDDVEATDKNEDDNDESNKNEEKKGEDDDSDDKDDAKGDDDDDDNDDVCVDTEASSDSDQHSIRQEVYEASEDNYDYFDGGNNDTNETDHDESREDEENVNDEDKNDSDYKDDEDDDESDDTSTDSGSTKNTSRIQKDSRHDENTNKPCNKSNSKKRRQSSPNPIDETIARKKARTSQINGQSNDTSFKAINTESSSDSEQSDSLYDEQTLRETGKKKHEKAKKKNIQSVDTVALCIVGKNGFSPSFIKKLERALLKTYKVKSQRFFIWQDLENTPELSKQNIVCFIKDLVEQCVDGHVEEMEKLLFDPCYLEKKEQTEYRPQGKFLQDVIISKQIWTAIKSQLADSKIGSIIMVEGTSNLVLLLDDSGIDQKGRLRKKLGMQEEGKEEVKEEMFIWTPSTVNNIIKENDADMCTLETEMILKWLKKKVKSPDVNVYPIEEALKAMSQNPSAAEDIGAILKTKESRQKMTSTILVFNQIEKEVVRFVPYWRRVFQSYLSQFSKSDQSLVLFDIRSLSSGVENKLRDVFIDENGKRLAVTLSSAFDPSSVPISCVVAQLTLTDSQVQTNKVKRSEKTTKSTAKSSMNNMDNKTPSTSTTHKRLK